MPPDFICDLERISLGLKDHGQGAESLGHWGGGTTASPTGKDLWSRGRRGPGPAEHISERLKKKEGVGIGGLEQWLRHSKAI